MAGQTVAVLSTALLSNLLGESIEVRKSAREGAKYPLYLSTCCGPLHLNTRTGQDFLLEYAVFNSPANPDAAPVAPENAPEIAPEKSPVSPLVNSVTRAAHPAAIHERNPKPVRVKAWWELSDEDIS